MVAAITSFERVVYTLTDVKPSSAQKFTLRTADAASPTSCICVIPMFGPLKYGEVRWSFGPGILLASIWFLRSRSVSGSMQPVVRADVTPAARYKRGNE